MVVLLQTSFVFAPKTRDELAKAGGHPDPLLCVCGGGHHRSRKCAHGAASLPPNTWGSRNKNFELADGSTCGPRNRTRSTSVSLIFVWLLPRGGTSMGRRGRLPWKLLPSFLTRSADLDADNTHEDWSIIRLGEHAPRRVCTPLFVPAILPRESAFRYRVVHGCGALCHGARWW